VQPIPMDEVTEFSTGIAGSMSEMAS